MIISDAIREIAIDLDWKTAEIILNAANLRILADRLDEQSPPALWRDIRAELPTNPNCPGLLANGWWRRRLNQIDGLTIHHTLSGSPHATAAYYITKDGGRPSLPYTFWITETGEILLCVDLEEGVWHDHTGHRNTHLSVGLAGSLHINHPPDVQLQAAARLARWALENEELSITSVVGHCDYYPTTCPGWNSSASGRWRTDFMRMI